MKFMMDELLPHVEANSDNYDDEERQCIEALYPDHFISIEEPINGLARCAMRRYDYPISKSN